MQTVVFSLLILVLSLLVGLLVVGSMLYRHLQRRSERMERALVAMRRDMRVLCTSAVGVGERLIEVEKRLSSTESRQDELEQRDNNEQPYQHAAKLVSMGADIDELIDNCGLSKAEPELVMLMHGAESDDASSFFMS